MKQRRKFERIETSNMNNQDTSSINHVFDADTIGKLSKCAHEEVQMLADCCKKSIKKLSLRDENEYRRKLSDPISHSSIRRNHPKMNKSLLYIAAVSSTVISFVAFSVIYFMAINSSHLKPGLYYISEIAMDNPESSIFAISLHMASITVAITLYIRHLALYQYLRDYGQERMKKIWVDISFWNGILIPFSLELIGNFPAINFYYEILHNIGVILFFINAILLTVIQTMITYFTINVLSDRRIYYLRFTITFLINVSAFAASVPGAISWSEFHGENYRNWRPSDGGWTYHIISVIAEWLFVFFSNFFVISIIYEYPTMIINVPTVKIRYLTIKEKTES